MQTTLQLITGIFARLLNRPGLILTLTDSPDSVTGWDSLTHPELLAAIEENLDIEFDFKELAGIKTIADLVNLTDFKLNAASK
jgi:acyl carrier protein